MAFNEDLDDAAKDALREMINLIGERMGLSREDAYMFASLAVDMRVTQLVDGNKGIHAMLPKHFARLDGHGPMRMGMMRAVPLAALIAGALVTAISARAEDPDPAIERGRAFAEQNCGRCHAIGSSGASPLAKAPPFRTLHERYPVENLTESLAEGIRTGHPEMPQFDALDTEQIDDLIAYLKSLEQ